jgi:hypothetical protein
MLKRVVLGVLVAVLTLGWAGLAEAGSRHHGGRGHGGGGHHKSSYRQHGGYYGGYYGGHRGGHHYYYGHDDRYAYYYYGALLAPLVLSTLTSWGAPRQAAAPAPASAYIEQQGQGGYWYYCTDPAGYHPYIQECPQGWMQVVPPSGPPR